MRERERRLIKYEDYTIEETDLEGIKEEYNRVIEESNVEECLYDRGLFVSNSHAEEDKTRRALEMMGSKIISASDVKSNRRLDYRFWKDEREFRNYDESKNVIGTEKEDEDGGQILSLVDIERDIEKDMQWTELLDMSDKKIVKALIQSMGEASVDGDVLNKILHSVHTFLKSINLSKREEEIIELLRGGKNQKEIADTLSVTGVSVSKSIDRVTDKVIKSGFDISHILSTSLYCEESINESLFSE